METLEHLKKVSKIKLIIMSLATLLPILILLVMEFVPSLGFEAAAFSDLVIFRYGIFVLLEGYIGIKIVNYIRILTDIDYVSSVLIKRNDERNRFIKLKTDSMMLKAGIYVLGIAMIVSAFLNRIVFYTLLAVLVTHIMIYLVVKFYYCKKY